MAGPARPSRGARGLGLWPDGPQALFIPREPDHWPGIIAGVVPQLEADGSRITAAADFPYRLFEPDDWYASVDEHTGEPWFDLELGVEINGERHSIVPLLTELIQQQPEAISQAWLDQIDPDSRLLLDLGDGRILPVPAWRVVARLRTLVELYDPQRKPHANTISLTTTRASALPALEAEADLSWRGDTEPWNTADASPSSNASSPSKRRGGSERRYAPTKAAAWASCRRSPTRASGAPYSPMTRGWAKRFGSLPICCSSASGSKGPAWWSRPSHCCSTGKTRSRASPRSSRYYDSMATRAMATWQSLATGTWFSGHVCAGHTGHRPAREAGLPSGRPRRGAGGQKPQAKSTQAVRRLKANQRLCLTGTPLANHLDELWSQFDFLLPGLPGDQGSLRRLFRRPIERDGDTGRPDALKQRIQPFLLRRSKQAIAAELPAKTEIQREAELTGEQRGLYETVRASMQERVRSEIAQHDLERSQVVILDALLKRRQVCCDPRLLKLDSARNITRSANLDMLPELLYELRAEGRQILLFSRFTSMLTLIEESLRGSGIKYVKPTGQTKKREERVNRFQAGEVPPSSSALRPGARA